MVAATGVVDVMREALDEAGEPVVQPSLFPSDQIASLPDGPLRVEALRQRGAGRPPGARNRRTEAFRDLVVRWGGGEHPARGLVEAYSRPVHDLARELGCTPLEAFKAQIDARRVMLEYVEGKMPVSVNVNGAGIIPVFFGDSGTAPGAADENEFFQPLSIEHQQQLEDGKLEDDQ